MSIISEQYKIWYNQSRIFMYSTGLQDELVTIKTDQSVKELKGVSLPT